MLLELILFALLGGVLVLAGFLTLRLLESQPFMLVYALLFLFVVQGGTAPNPLQTLLQVRVAGIHFYPLDLIATAAFVCAMIRLYGLIVRGFGRFDKPLLLLLAWFLILGFNYLSGVSVFGLQAATNEFRSYYYTLAVALYVGLLDWSAIWHRLERGWLLTLPGLFLLAAYGYAHSGLSDRPLNSHEALLVLQAGVIGYFMLGDGRLSGRWLPWVMAAFPIVLLLQHRSVWVVGLVSLGFIFFFLPRLRGPMLKWGGIGTVLIGGVGMATFGAAVVESLGHSYRSALDTSERSTFMWRIQGWLIFLRGDQLDTWSKILIGNPFGTGWTREVRGTAGSYITHVSPHNYYIQTLLRSGAVGVLLLLSLYRSVIRTLLREARLSERWRPPATCLAVLLIGQMIYFIPYAPQAVQGVLLGAAIAWSRSDRQSLEPEEIS